MPVIGLTGNIASGKSTVSKILKDLGAEIIDADVVAREVVQPGTPGWKQIVESFGREILNPDGTINRKELGARVFNDASLMKQLNGITHPLIGAEITERINRFKAGRSGLPHVLVIDAPLLIETGLHRFTDQVWLVDIPAELQVKRLMARSSLTREEALRRIQSQMPAEDKKKFADVVIDNSGTMENTRKKVLSLWHGFSRTGGRTGGV